MCDWEYAKNEQKWDLSYLKSTWNTEENICKKKHCNEILELLRQSTSIL
jgi:hypothetical protein